MCVCVCVCVCVFVCVCVCKLKSFSIKTGSKIGVEAIEHNYKNWLNQKNLETALGYKNLVSSKTRYYFDEFKKGRYEIQDCEHFQPCKKFIVKNLNKN